MKCGECIVLKISQISQLFMGVSLEGFCQFCDFRIDSLEPCICCVVEISVDVIHLFAKLVLDGLCSLDHELHIIFQLLDS